MTGSSSSAADAGRRRMPPFRPDPELMWNLDGNVKQAEKDADDVREYLRRLDEQERRSSAG